MLETAAGQDVCEHNIPERAHIIVNPRKASTPKDSAATKKSALAKAVHRKKAVCKRQEVEDDESAGEDMEEVDG